MIPSVRLIMAFCLVLSCRASMAQTTPLAFQHVRLFDGHQTTEDTTVVIARGAIQAVAPDAPVPPGATVIDGHGKTLLPGLIDAHVHIHGALSLEEALVMGVTTELDMMSGPRMDAMLHQQENSQWADFRAAGILATVPGGHGTEYGTAIPTIDKPQQAEAWVQARIQEGSDYIKLVYGDSTIFGGRFPMPTLDKKTMAAIITAAHAHDKLAVVHINTEQDARDGLNAGADGLAHLFFGAGVSKDFGTFVAAHHAFVIPTLSVLSGTCDPIPVGASLTRDPNVQPWLMEGQKRRLKEGRRMMNTQRGMPFGMQTVSCTGAYKAVAQLVAANVPILVGSDAPNLGTAHGATVHGEMEELVKAGMTPEQVLASATSLAALQFHLAGRGSVLPGMRADLLLVNGDPTKNISDTRNIVGIWKAGAEVHRTRPTAEGNDGIQP
jgi:cytosine/adenosine deaminase-related metal-dependent hydrolase